MTFEASLADRSSDDYADFLRPHLASGFHLIDVGCGDGAISLGLARVVSHVTAVDLDEASFTDARNYAPQHGIRNIEFSAGSVYALDYPSDRFEACFCHSLLETLERPVEALQEIKRILKPGGVLGIACVDYGGLILAGPNSHWLTRFYDIRKQLWQMPPAADPYRGRELRGLLHQAGFESIAATSRYICHGTEPAVLSFGLARADDCLDAWYATSAQQAGLATGADLQALRDAWIEWSRSPLAYAAFPWCRAVGWKSRP